VKTKRQTLQGKRGGKPLGGARDVNSKKRREAHWGNECQRGGDGPRMRGLEFMGSTEEVILVRDDC